MYEIIRSVWRRVQRPAATHQGAPLRVYFGALNILVPYLHFVGELGRCWS